MAIYENFWVWVLCFIVCCIPVQANHPFDKRSHFWERSRPSHSVQSKEHSGPQTPAYFAPFPHFQRDHHPPFTDDHPRYQHEFGAFGDWAKQKSGTNPNWFLPKHHDIERKQILNPDTSKQLGFGGEDERHQMSLDKSVWPNNVELDPIRQSIEQANEKGQSVELSEHDRLQLFDSKVSAPRDPHSHSQIHGAQESLMRPASEVRKQTEESRISRRRTTSNHGELLVASEDHAMWRLKEKENVNKNPEEAERGFMEKASLLNIVGSNPPVREDGMLVEDPINQPHQIFMEHFPENIHQRNERGHPSPKVDEPGVSRTILADQENPANEIVKDNTVEFTSGAFQPKQPDENKFDVTRDEIISHAAGKSTSTNTNDINQNVRKQSIGKTWMNFRLLFDDDGKLKLEMSPSDASSKPSPVNGQHRVGLMDNHNENNNKYQLSTNQRISPRAHDPAQPPVQFLAGYTSMQYPNPPNDRFFSYGPRRGDRLMFEDMHRAPPELHSLPARPPFAGMHEPIHHPWHVPPHGPNSHGAEFVAFDQPKLLSERISSPQAARSHEDTTILDAVSIPLLIDVDNPLTSGCAKLKCASSCPGDLRKLSSITGCPTCDCCPTVQCSLRCAFGYAADSSGCPVCKCLTQ